MDTVKRLGEKGHPALRLPFKEIPGAFIILSFRGAMINKAHLDYYIRYQEPFTPDEAYVTFFYGGEKYGAEWEPKYGPIMLYRPCSADWKGMSPFDSPLSAKEHWFYDYVEDSVGSWSQMAVESEGLKHKLATGDFEAIFHVLKRWTERD